MTDTPRDPELPTSGPIQPLPKSPKPSWRKRIREWAIELVIALVLVSALQWWRTRDAARGPAPALVGTTVTGDRVALADLRGQPVLVHFWATWCGVCKTMDGTIDAVAKDHTVVTIASDSGSSEDVVKFLEREGFSFRAVDDSSGSIARRWGVNAFPTTFVIDPKGDVDFVTMGWSSSLGLRARMWLARL